MKNRNGILVLMVMMLLSACASAATETSAPTDAVIVTEAVTDLTGVEQELCTPEAMSTSNATGLVIGTGGQGGVFYPYGEGLATILNANLTGVTATFIETGGSVDNVKMVQKGGVQIGFSTVDSAYDAILGQAAYAETGTAHICALAVLYTSFVHVVASEASGINGIADMKGKVVSFGDSGSSTEGAADRIFEAVGLNPQSDVTRQNLNIADSAAAMSAGTIDAFFWIGGLPTKAVTDMLSAGTAVKFIDASGTVDSMVSKYGPVYSAFTLPKDVYGTEADVPGIGIGNILFVNETMSEDQAYQILKITFEHLDDVHALHPQAVNLALESAVNGSSIPFHPGAIKFYAEQGLWK